MKKPRKITLVPARSMVQLGTTGTGRSFALPVFGQKSMHLVDFPTTGKFISIDTEQGSPQKMWARFGIKAAKEAATNTYNKRVKQKQQAHKPKPVVSNSYKNILAGGQFGGLVNGEPETFSVPTSRRASKAPIIVTADVSDIIGNEVVRQAIISNSTTKMILNT